MQNNALLMTRDSRDTSLKEKIIFIFCNHNNKYSLCFVESLTRLFFGETKRQNEKKIY